MITVSVCMIVKNEEDKLARCLDCLVDFADEIIIVDTGSTDATKEIAGRYTDKIYDFQWIDDFSAARNYSFSKATMEYIYTADADEIIDENNQKKLMQIKQVLLPEIDIVQMNYTNQLEFGSTYNYDSEPRPKLFKRLRQFTWKDPVHETIQTFPVVYDSEIDIIHKPHESHCYRDLQTFEKAIKRNHDVDPKDVTAGISANARCMYAKELIMCGDKERLIAAKDYFKRMADSGVLDNKELNEAICVLSMCAVIENNPAMLMKYAMKNVCETAYSEVCNFVGEYYYNNGDYDEAYIWFYNAVYETKPLLVVKYGKEIPLENMAKCLEAAGDFGEAKRIREELKQCGKF